MASLAEWPHLFGLMPNSLLEIVQIAPTFLLSHALRSRRVNLLFSVCIKLNVVHRTQ